MKHRSLKYRTSDETGQTLVEFALILILILIVLFGITEFGRAWFYTNALTNGVRTGVRYATTLDNSTGFEAKVSAVTMANITSSIPNDNLVIEVYLNENPGNTAFGNLTGGELITVRATTDFSFLTGIMDIAFGKEDAGPNSLSRKASMRYQ